MFHKHEIDWFMSIEFALSATVDNIIGCILSHSACSVLGTRDLKI